MVKMINKGMKSRNEQNKSIQMAERSLKKVDREQRSGNNRKPNIKKVNIFIP